MKLNCFHPGELQITNRALEICRFQRGDRILDIGCGEGKTMEYLQECCGLDVIGCDLSEDMIKRAKKRNPKLKVSKCDGLTLAFPSLYFDGALMECSFSLMSRHTELLRELFCILKPSAMIVISDLYMIEPYFAHSEAPWKEQYNLLIQPESLIYNENERSSPCLLDGMFIKDSLIQCLEQNGFEMIAWEDKTQELRNYIAQVLMDYGSFENMWETRLPQGADVKKYCNVSYGKNTGYFLLVAKKVEIS